MKRVVLVKAGRKEEEEEEEEEEGWSNFLVNPLALPLKRLAMCHQFTDDIPLYSPGLPRRPRPSYYTSHRMRVGRTMQGVGWCTALPCLADSHFHNDFYLHVALSNVAYP